MGVKGTVLLAGGGGGGEMSSEKKMGNSVDFGAEFVRHRSLKCKRGEEGRAKRGNYLPPPNRGWYGTPSPLPLLLPWLCVLQKRQALTADWTVKTVTGNNWGKATDCYRRHQPSSCGGEIVKKEIQSVNSEFIRCWFFLFESFCCGGTESHT